MADSKTFIAQIGKFAKEAPEKMDALARQTVQELGKRVVEATPVDVGFLRGSWQPSIGEPSRDHEGSNDIGGTKVAAAISVLLPEIKAGVMFYLMNNAVYARRLEYGFNGKDSLNRTYNQAGRFYVTDTAKSWPAIVRDVLADLKGKK